MNKNSSLEQAFNPQLFEYQAEQVVQALMSYLQSAQSEAIITNDYQSPEDSLAYWQKHFDHTPFDLKHFLQTVLDRSMHLHHPKYVGHQVGVVAPLSALMSLVSSLLNNGMAVYEVGQVSSTLERIVIKELAPYFGYGEQADGVLTSGGTLGNLTALLTARACKAKESVWENGHTHKLAIIVSEEAHYCVDRAVRTMGWGEEGAIKVPTDDRFRMRTELLESLLQEAQRKGIQVIAIVGSACTTSTGTFDDLKAIGAFCQAHDLWFHVDGAHGAAAVFSPDYQKLVDGIEMADSVVMDFHKMLLTPALTTGVFYKDGKHAYRTFHQKAHYLWNNQEETEWFNYGKRTFECTKLMMSLKVYAIMKAYGISLWEEYVTQMFDLGKEFAQLIRRTPNFELAIEPDCNIVCFRYAPKEVEDLELLNNQIHQRLYEKGDFYFVKTKLRGNTYLRTTLMNPSTRLSHLQELLEQIEEEGIKLTQTIERYSSIS